VKNKKNIMKDRIVALWKRHYYLLTSILMFLSFPSYDIWILKGFPLFAWVSMVPMFMIARQSSLRQLYMRSFGAGLVGCYLTYEWIGHFGDAVPGGPALILTFLIPSLSVFFAAKVTLGEILARRCEKLRFLIIPSIWICIDWIESIGFLAYPWPVWGYSQYPFTAFIQIASITGVAGVTFIVILVNVLLADLIQRLVSDGFSIHSILRLPEGRHVAVAVGAVVAMTAWGGAILLMNDRPARNDMRVALIQSCISPWENWSENRFLYLAQLKSITKKAIDNKPDFIIWSESATLETISFDYQKGTTNEFENEVFTLARESGLPILTGEIGIVEVEEGFFLKRYPQNNAVLINSAGEVEATYPKIHLVPFGEWFPYEKWFPAVKRLAASMGGSSFLPGDEPVIFTVGGKKFACLVCYEGIFNRLCRKNRNLGAEFLVNITNDGWTHTYKGHMQHFAASVFRAVENGVWYLRAGNTGYTAFIDPWGRVRASIPILIPGYLVSDIDFRFNHRTIYMIVGDAFQYLAICFVLILACVAVIKTIRERGAKRAG